MKAPPACSLNRPRLDRDQTPPWRFTGSSDRFRGAAIFSRMQRLPLESLRKRATLYQPWNAATSGRRWSVVAPGLRLSLPLVYGCGQVPGLGLNVTGPLPDQPQAPLHTPAPPAGSVLLDHRIDHPVRGKNPQSCSSRGHTSSYQIGTTHRIYPHPATKTRSPVLPAAARQVTKSEQCPGPI